MTVRFSANPPSPPVTPKITFASQRDLFLLSQLLNKHRGTDEDEHRLEGLIYSFLIYDHYAHAYRKARKGNESQAEAWRILATHRAISDLYARMLTRTDEIRLGDTELNLPIQPASLWHDKSAPIGIKTLTYKLQRLGASQFAEIAWIVHCNLLHGTYDPGDEETWNMIKSTSRPMMWLVWEMLVVTAA